MKKLKNLTVALTLALAAALAGCRGTSDALVKPQQQAALVRGATTKSELLARLGEPDKTSDLGGGKEEMQYFYENAASQKSWFHPSKSALWIVLKNGKVEAYGERSTMTDQNSHRFWPF